MESFLRAQYLDDGDGTGKLMLWAQADGFSGNGGAYFNIERIADFAESIGMFPLPPEDERCSLSGGLGEDELLAVSVYPADSQRGYIGIQVRLATEVWPHIRPESKKQVVLEVLTTHEPLRKFSRELLAVLKGSLREAVLEGQSPS